MACFRCNTTEDFIFSLKYRQRKVDVNTSKKLLVFITIQAIIYENFIFTQKYAFAERCCFLTFSFEGNVRKYDISVKRKYTKTNENMIFSALFTNFCKTKILFFIQYHYRINWILNRLFRWLLLAFFGVIWGRLVLHWDLCSVQNSILNGHFTVSYWFRTSILKAAGADNLLS